MGENVRYPQPSDCYIMVQEFKRIHCATDIRFQEFSGQGQDRPGTNSLCTREAGRLFFFTNTGALPGEVEMDSDDCAIAVAINNNNSYEAKAGIREKSSQKVQIAQSALCSTSWPAFVGKLFLVY